MYLSPGLSSSSHVSHQGVFPSFFSLSLLVSMKGGGLTCSSLTNACFPLVWSFLLKQMCMKGGSSMLYLTFEGENQLCHPLFWILLFCWLALSIATIWLIPPPLTPPHTPAYPAPTPPPTPPPRRWLSKGLMHLEV